MNVCSMCPSSLPFRMERFILITFFQIARCVLHCPALNETAVTPTPMRTQPLLHFTQTCTIEPFLEKYSLNVDLKVFKKCEIVVVTAMFGGTDILRPAYPSYACSIAFLDECSYRMLPAGLNINSDGKVLGWSIVRVNHSHLDLRVASRIFKLLLPQIFPFAVFSIWADGKSQLMVEPSSLIRDVLLTNNADMGMVSNPYRKSIYDEHNAIVSLGLANKTLTAIQSKEYMRQGVPHNSGLIDGTVILRNHRSSASNLFSCAWYQEFLKFPPRDQASFGFVAHSLGYKPSMSQKAFSSLKKSKTTAFLYINKESRIYVMAWCRYLKLFRKHAHHRRHGLCKI